MKLHRLTIKNIASIENAEIDFDKAPLCDSPIFLITGDTGAGKTTILNAICLALYNKVPSLETIGTAENDREGIRTDNPRQLVRRGAGSAEITLTFEDSNGRYYKAIWRVRRARGKANGKMQKTEREIEDVTEGITFVKEDEIKDIIARSTGLTFDQFTRTTMLAQGQFATFMKAKDADKSEILEKLTGTDIYARIGNRIYERLAEKKDTANTIENEIKGQSEQLLSETEIDEMRNKIESTTAATAELTSRIEILNTRIHWLTQYVLLKKEEEKRNGTLKKASEAAESEEIRYMKSLVDSWKSTIEIRNTIAENYAARQQADILKKDIVTVVHNSYIPITEGILWLREKQESLKLQKKEIDLNLSRESKNAKLYSEASRIEEKAQNVKRQKAQEATLYSEYLNQTAEYDKSLQSEVKLKEKQAKDCEVYENLAKETELLYAEIGGIDITALTNAANNYSITLAKLNEQQQAVEIYRSREAEHTAAEAQLSQSISEEAKTISELSEAKERLPHLEKLYADRVRLLQARMQLNDHINQVRQRFADTHECPLCGSNVDKLLPDDTLDRELENAKNEAEQSRESLEKLTRDIAALEATLSSQEKDVKAKTTDKAKKHKDLVEAEKSAMALVPDYNNRDVISRIVESRNKTLELQDLNKKALDVALAKRQRYDNSIKATAKARTEMEKTAEALRNRQNNTQALKAKADSTLLLCHQAKDSALSLLSEISNIVGEFAEVNVDNYFEVAVRITELSAEYTRTIKRSEDIDKEINDINGIINRCDSTLAPIKPRIGEAEIQAPHPLKDIEKEISVFAEKLNRLEGQLTSCTSKISSTEKVIADYFADDGAYTREKLDELANIGKNNINRYEEHIKKISEAKSTAKGAVEAIANQIEAHEAVKPDMLDNTDIDTLTKQRSEAEAAREANIKEKAAAEANLEKDTSAKKSLATKIKSYESIQKEKEQWQMLENLFGGAGGRKFRNLAQSYVLRALLAKANHYLTRLNNRYTLDCEDGSLTINVIDHHQGGCVRNVGLLSGGEGFIVSLALALGLSAISKQKIDVDVLFIDEGFGSLDQDTLDTVITTLNNLHRIGNRRIGVISHVGALKERIATQICVTHDTPTSSKVTVAG